MERRDGILLDKIKERRDRIKLDKIKERRWDNIRKINVYILKNRLTVGSL